MNLGIIETLSIFDELDFIMDTIPHGLSFQVNLVKVKDFSDLPISETLITQLKDDLNPTTDTLTGKTKAAQILQVFSQKFAEGSSCCIRLGFLYHEFQNAFSISNIRKQNIQLILKSQSASKLFDSNNTILL
jgi:hypothetical protein